MKRTDAVALLLFAVVVGCGGTSGLSLILNTGAYPTKAKASLDTRLLYVAVFDDHEKVVYKVKIADPNNIDLRPLGEDTTWKFIVYEVDLETDDTIACAKSKLIRYDPSSKSWGIIELTMKGPSFCKTLFLTDRGGEIRRLAQDTLSGGEGRIVD